MKRVNGKKAFSIPIIIPIIIIVGIILIVCCKGKELITNSAQYVRANAATTDASRFKYTQLEDGTLKITGYTGSDEAIVIPEVIDGKVITSIGESAFTGKWNIKSVQIPQTVTKIGKKAFYNCKKLEEINIPKNITVIEESILESTAITSIQIPRGVTSIGANAFSGTLLTRVKLPESVITIGANAFQSCYYLQEINIPKGVTVIESATFQSCAFESIELPEGITSIGESAFVLCEELKSIDIPETVTTIGPNAFKWCDGLTSVVIPNGVTMIDSSAFSECDNLSKLVIPDSVTEFGSGIYKKGTIYCRSNSKAEEYAKTNNITYVIDDKEPEVKGIVGNPTEWTTYDVKITVNAEEAETESGLWRKAYSFDGGKTWQKENNKTYTENTNGIIIKVKDNLTNIYTSEEINITKIDKEFPTIFGVTKSTEEPTKGSVTLTIDADDAISGLADLPYSFNGGTTWQAENTETYTGNVTGLQIKVKDKAGNITDYSEKINITNIIEVESIKITSLPVKTNYNAYEDLDRTGLVVTATYADGSEEEITDYRINGDKNLSCKQTKIVIQYNGDYSLKDEFAISVAHAYEEIITAPTCTAQGYTTKKCEICFDSNAFDYVDALGHSYGEWSVTKEPTYIEKGEKQRVCASCRNVEKEEIQVINYENIVKSWDVSATENDNVVAILYNEGTFIITGTGNMKSFSGNGEVPWAGHMDSIKNAMIDEGIKNISNYLFFRAVNLEKLTISKGVKTIGGSIVEGTSKLTEVEIPESVRKIDIGAFTNSNTNSGLINIKVNSNNKDYSDIEGVLYNKDYTKLICYPTGKIEEKYIVPSTVKEIDMKAFQYSRNLKVIELPEGLEIIDGNAFDCCINLTSINIPDGVKEILTNAFANCSNLENIEIPDTVETFGWTVFSGTRIKNITIPSSVTNIGKAIFYNCSNLEKVNVYCKSYAEEYIRENYNNKLNIIHIYDEGIVTQPTCTEKGYTTHKCTRCEYSYVDTYVDATSHDHKETVTPPTCTEKGYTTHKCTRCEDSYVDTYVDATSHNYEDLKCKNCGEEVPKITITTENFEISEDYITKIPTGTTVKELKEQIQITNATEIKLLNKKGEELTDDDIIATGTTLILKSEFETKTLKLVVVGDATGDGVADFKDIVAINRHRLNKKLLEGENLLAADVTGDGKADFKDIVKINRFRLNKITQLISILVK